MSSFSLTVVVENLRQTNLAMKQQLSTVSLVQDRALEAQKKQQQKFEETKALILKVGLSPVVTLLINS